jgi:superfamily II DNA or RNA helicase
MSASSSAGVSESLILIFMVMMVLDLLGFYNMVFCTCRQYSIYKNAMQLRPYQIQGRANIAAAWANGARHVLYVLPTGGGKTTTFAHIAADHDGPVAAVAHRQELVGQIAMAFAREGVRHRLIAPTSVVKNIVRAQTLELGRSFFDPNAHVGVVGVDTLHARAEGVKAWADSVTLWIMDEAHHVLRKNKWGAAVDMFPNARGLGVTATPCRAIPTTRPRQPKSAR